MSEWDAFPAAPKDKSEWDAFPAAPDVTTDVVNSVAVAPAKVGIGMVGAIPALSSAMHSGANKYLFDPLFNAISGPPKTPRHQPFDINQTIEQGLGSVSNKLYEPKTDQGRYAGAAAEGVTGAFLGPGGAAMKVAQGIGSGLGSEAMADYFKGTALEPYMRFVGGVGGGLATGATGKGVELLRNKNAAITAGQDIGDVIGGGAVKGSAVNRVAQNVADAELTPAQVQATVQQLGPRTMVADLDHQLQARADMMAQHSGKAQNTIYKPIVERTEGASNRINDVLDNHMGPSRDVVQLQNALDDFSKTHISPAYQALEQRFPVVNDVRLQELAQRPAIAEAMRRAEGVAANYGEQISGASPSIKYWDYVKKSMDQRINGMMRSGMDDLSSAQKADLGGLINAKQALVQHLDNVTGGEYAQARKLATTKPAMEDALEFGRGIFSNKLLPEQVSSHFNDLSLAEQEMVRTGARREIERAVNTPGDEGRKLRSLLSGGNNRQKFEAILGPKATDDIFNTVASENQFQELANKIHNSRTATRIEGMRDTQAPTMDHGSTLYGALTSIPRHGVNYALEQGMANTRNDISRILTAKGNQIDPTIRMLLDYNAQKAANASAPAGQQAAAVIRALIAGDLAHQ